MSDVRVKFLMQEEGGRVCAVQGKCGETLLEAAKRGGVAIEHACGGVCACSTCHVWVKEGMGCLSEAEDSELDRVEQAADVRPFSRLSCQARIERDGEIVCEIPAWNRNAVKEG